MPFKEATQLASGVRRADLGRLGRQGEVDRPRRQRLRRRRRSRSTRAYAPIPEDTRAILRQKTLLGETYVELTPGQQRGGPSLPEGGALPPAQVADSVQLDEIFRAFDPPTRAAFQAWMQGQAASLRGRGEDLSIALASLTSFADSADRLLRLLDSQDVAAAPASSATAARPSTRSPSAAASCAGLIENAAQVFATTADRNAGARGHLPDLPDLPARVARDADAPRAVRGRHRPGRRRRCGPPRASWRRRWSTSQRLAPQLDSFFAGAARRRPRSAPKGLPATRDAARQPTCRRCSRASTRGWPSSTRSSTVFGKYKHELTSAARQPRRGQQRRLLRPDPRQGVPLPAHRGAAGARGDLDLSAPAHDLAHQPVLQARRATPTCARACESFEVRQCSIGRQRLPRPDLAEQPGLQRAHRRRRRPRPRRSSTASSGSRSTAS